MSEVNFDNFKCRCSSIHKLLAESRSNPCITEKQRIRLAELEKKAILTENMQAEMADLLVKKQNSSKIILSDTAIEYLMEWYAWFTAGKVSVSKETMYIEYVEKGNEVEDQSITLLSVVEGEIYQKNEVRVDNEFLTGIPDVFKGEEIMAAIKITDIKSAWDYPGFLKKIQSKVTNGNELQVQGYMDITGATEGEIAHCLVNTPERLIHDLRDSLLKKMYVATDIAPEFLAAYDELLRSCYFDDIPMNKRVFRMPIKPFEEFQRQRLYDRVKVAREWLWKFDEMYQNINSFEEKSLI